MSGDAFQTRQAVLRCFEWVAGDASFTPLFSDGAALRSLGPGLSEPFRDSGVTAVVAPEARGFVPGSLCATSLGVGLIAARKPGGPRPDDRVYVESEPDWRGLDDPATAGRIEDCGPPGEKSFASAVDMTCTSDVLIHTWDIAQAAGIDAVLDAGEIARQDDAIRSIPPEVDAAMRDSLMFGPRLTVPADADAVTRVLGFYGRHAGERRAG